MIDFYKELEKYSQIPTSMALTGEENETSAMIKLINSNIIKFNKNQININTNLEEAITLLDCNLSAHESLRENFISQKENESILTKNTVKDLSEELNSIISGVVKIFDIYEDMYRFFLMSADGVMKTQVSLIWENLNKLMQSINFTRIDDKDTIFNPQLNTISETISVCPSDSNMLFQNYDRTISEVLRCGYKYKDQVVRKSLVIVRRVNP